jgi:hypothetical protein
VESSDDSFQRRKYGRYSGPSSWGSTPPNDVKRRAIYIATSKHLHHSSKHNGLRVTAGEFDTQTIPDPCLEYDNHQESVLSISMDTGAIKWLLNWGNTILGLSCAPSLGQMPRSAPRSLATMQLW